MPENVNSTPISWADAELMNAAYMANPHALNTPASGGGFETLQAFLVDSEALQNIIAGVDPEGNPVQDPATSIMLLFGVRSEDLAKPPADQCFTTILVGVNAENEVQKEVVYDFTKPCPPGTPNF
ncbi:MAG TPA: hypothetical protein DIW47_08185 [Bacteroidetes bacterium]|nr:hypothetical protein [Bacteroidota bacterium]